MQFQNNPNITLTVGASAVAQYVFVKLDGTVCGLDTTKDWVGVTMEPRAALAKNLPVRLMTAGTVPATASEAIAAGDVVYKAANGRLSKTATGSIRVGIAKLPAGAAGEFFEVIPD